jgi:hypothetical protein
MEPTRLMLSMQTTLATHSLKQPARLCQHYARQLGGRLFVPCPTQDGPEKTIVCHPKRASQLPLHLSTALHACGICRNMQEYAGICRNMQEYAGICRNMQEYAWQHGGRRCSTGVRGRASTYTDTASGFASSCHYFMSQCSCLLADGAPAPSPHNPWFYRQLPCQPSTRIDHTSHMSAGLYVSPDMV